MIEKGIVQKILAAEDNPYKNVVLRLAEYKAIVDHAKLAAKLRLTDDEDTVQAVVMRKAMQTWVHKQH